MYKSETALFSVFSYVAIIQIPLVWRIFLRKFSPTFHTHAFTVLFALLHAKSQFIMHINHVFDLSISRKYTNLPHGLNSIFGVLSYVALEHFYSAKLMFRFHKPPVASRISPNCKFEIPSLLVILASNYLGDILCSRDNRMCSL